MTKKLRITTTEANVGRKPWNILMNLTKYWEAGLPTRPTNVVQSVSQFHSIAGNCVVAIQLRE